MELVHERVAPADDVSGRPPVLPERMARLRDEHRLEAARAVAVGAEDLQLVQPLHVECERALRPVDLPLEGVAPAVGEARGLERADGAVRELDGGLDRVVDLAVRQERLREARHCLDLAVEEAREIDDVGHQVAESARAGFLGMEAPRVERDVVAPVLQIAAAEVAYLAELAGLDHLARETDRRHKAIVERAHVLDAGRGDAAPDVVALAGVAAERLLANDVLAGLRCRDRRLGVERVRAAVVEEPDSLVGDEVPPVAGRILPAVTSGGLLDRVRVAARDADEPRLERWRPRDVRDLLERVGVRLAHERVPQHADADLSHRTRYYARQFNQRETKWRTQSSGGSSRRPTSTGR